jgi:uncharacterized membrane protein YcfT
MAILMVTLYHADTVLGKIDIDTGIAGDTHLFLRPLRMPLFFSVSGLFAFSAITGSYTNLWNRRLRQYIWLLVLWTCIMWMFGKLPIFSDDPAYPRDITSLIKNIIRPLGNIWFLWCLPLYFIAAKLMRQFYPRVVVGILCLLSIAAFFVDRADLQGGLLGYVKTNIAILSAPKFFVFFWASANYRDKVLSWVPSGIKHCLLLIMAFVACRGLVLYFDKPLVTAFLSLPSAGLGVLLLMSFSKMVPHIASGVASPLRALGTQTVPLYVIQMPLMVLLVSPLEGNVNGSPAIGILLHILLALAAVLTAQILASLAEKLHFNWLFDAPSATCIKTA